MIDRSKTSVSGSPLRGFRSLAAALGLLFAAAGTALAYPPAPPHVFTGMVRNEWGDPLDITGAQVFLETTNGVKVTSGIVPSSGSGVNYRLEVPMDTRTATDLYSDSAMVAGFPFRLKVRIGAKTYMPMEMTVAFQSIGKPAQTTRLDLTLGVDSDGDGLPDAWETANGLNPNDPTDADKDSDGDGLSNRAEYQIGTYAFDPSVGFALTPVGIGDGQALVEFFTVRGRTYSLLTSTDLQTWTPTSAKPVVGGVPGAAQPTYTATDYRVIRMSIPVSTPAPPSIFFKATVR